MRPILPLRFESIQTLRETATASTFVAADHVLGRNNVVVKSIRKGRFADERSSLGEIFSWYRGLRHAHVAGILDAGLAPNGDLFYVRDFAPPTQLFSTKNMELLNVLLGVVDFLHSMGRVHGSIKPSNVLATSKSVQLADPWIPQPWTSPSTEEEVRFSAPEVLKGEPRTIESDLYSLGALLYRFFSGRDLFDDSDLESLIARHIWASPRPLASISYVSRAIADIVENLIHKDPAQRRRAFETLKNELRVESVAAVRSPAIGMTEPLEKAERFLQSNVDRLRILVVEAPVGFGKTRYIEELCHRMTLRAPNLAFSVCPTVGQSSDVILAQWLLSVFERHCSSFKDPSVRRLQALVDGSSDSLEPFDSERIDHDFVDVLASITQKNPLTLVIEDIDRANGKVCRLIDSIVSRGTRLRLCIVVTTRPGGIKPKTLQAFKDYVRSMEHISLGHLSDTDSESIASFLERDDDRRSVARENAGGNPLFLEEYCKAQKPGVPRVVRSTISKLVSALPRPTRRIAEVLSLFEEPVTLEVLQQVAGMPNADLEQHLAYLRSLGFSDSSIALRHNDTRALLHSRIPSSWRTELHARCYEHLKGSAISKKHLARHAYIGALFDVAGRLYLTLAKEAFRARDFKSTVGLYEVVQQCRKRSMLVPPASTEDTITLASCRGYLGEPSHARNALKLLLKQEEVRSDPELLSSVYSACASPFIESSKPEQIRLLKLAIASLKPDSTTLPRRYGSLINALLAIGNVKEADATLERFPKTGAEQTFEQSEELRSITLMSRGKFKEAADCFRRKERGWAVPAAATNDLAVCLEQLGRIHEAKEIQLNALTEVRAQEAATLEIVCLGNLGSMETKLGNTTEAQNLFQVAITKLERIRRKELVVYPHGICYADAALHWICRGNYHEASYCIAQLNSAKDGPFSSEAFQCLLARCELNLASGNFKAVTTILDRAKEFEAYGEFFGIECLLVRTRVQDPSEQLCAQLKSAWETSMRHETRYQGCRVLIALARTLSSRGDLSGAGAVATQALELAQIHGYRLLAAQALLEIGLAAKDDAQRQSNWSHCLQEASDIGLYPLLAECAFHMGDWRSSCGDYLAARDHLFRSVSITSRMAEGFPASNRTKYLSLPFHQKAKRLLEEATTKTREILSVHGEPLGKEDLFFSAVYRLAASLAPTSDYPTILATFAHSVRQCVPQTGVVILEQGTDLAFCLLNGKATESTKERALSAFRKASRRIFFASLEKKDGQGSAVWVPIPCLSLRAGIYIECPETPTALGEQEIQFLTVTATLVGAALDQIVGKQLAKGREQPRRELEGIIGNAKSMQNVFANIEVASLNSATVLIEGESGTGKELVAKAIHFQSSRTKAPFVPVDCGAVPEDLIEAELFGTRKGSFTGAVADRLGLFESADGGSIFLDEISNASPALQTKLLRVLQEKEIRRVGDTKGRRIDVRLIAATNRNLERLVEQGEFRQDLLFRLKVLHIKLPQLSERKEDVPLLAVAFLSKLNALNQSNKQFGVTVMDDLMAHDYPGNVRELQNIVERSFYGTHGLVINKIALGSSADVITDKTEMTEDWFQDLVEGRKSWSAVRDRYKRRDISRERVIALLDRGLRFTQGNYRAVASMFKIKDTEYRHFIDFLRRSDCLLDFRPYRKAESRS